MVPVIHSEKRSSILSKRLPFCSLFYNVIKGRIKGLIKGRIKDVIKVYIRRTNLRLL